jgi:hypothetical protein
VDARDKPGHDERRRTVPPGNMSQKCNAAANCSAHVFIQSSISLKCNRVSLTIMHAIPCERRNAWMTDNALGGHHATSRACDPQSQTPFRLCFHFGLLPRAVAGAEPRRQPGRGATALHRRRHAAVFIGNPRPWPDHRLHAAAEGEPQCGLPQRVQQADRAIGLGEAIRRRLREGSVGRVSSPGPRNARPDDRLRCNPPLCSRSAKRRITLR